MKKKVRIKNLTPNYLANVLISNHTIGEIRDKDDLENIIYHSKVTIESIIDLLGTIGKTDDKIKLLRDTYDDLDKFVVKKKNDE